MQRGFNRETEVPERDVRQEKQEIIVGPQFYYRISLFMLKGVCVSVCVCYNKEMKGKYSLEASEYNS